MDEGEPIVDFQIGAMSGPNRAVDHCTIEVLFASTFTVLTFRNNYNQTRVSPHWSGPLGVMPPDIIDGSVSFPATTVIRGVKSYQLAGGTIIAYHYKN
jgi:hypothetical protein